MVNNIDLISPRDKNMPEKQNEKYDYRKCKSPLLRPYLKHYKPSVAIEMETVLNYI